MSAARSATELAPAVFFADDFATVLAFAHARKVPFSSTPAVGLAADFAFADGADFATVLVALFAAAAVVGLATADFAVGFAVAADDALVADDFLSTDCTDDTDFATGLGAIFAATADDDFTTADFAAGFAVDFLAADDATADFADEAGFLSADTDTPLFVPPIKNSIQ